MAEGSVIQIELKREERELLEQATTAAERAARWRKVCAFVDTLLALILFVDLLLKVFP